MRIFTWIFRAFVFFALFAFAVNNQHDAMVRWFFGQAWHAPMVYIVLAAFALGCLVGAVAMVPSWWRHRRVATRQRSEPPVPAPAVPAPVQSELPLEHPPRDGL